MIGRRSLVAGTAAAAVTGSAPKGAGAQHRLFAEIGAFRFDPLGYVMYAFPWGVAGTPLEKEEGPEPWQRKILVDLGKGLLTVSEAIRFAVASGHGIGKSALVAWIILWAMSTVRDTRGVVTANTEGQLRTKTWPELAKWHGLAINGGWFECTATAIYSAFQGHEKTWRCDAISWSENNTEAIAGLHNKGRRAFAIFDEASAIPDNVWEVMEGTLTDADTELFWTAFGNPTRNVGRFRECFAGGRFARRWNGVQIDSRTVRLSNKSQTDQWVTDYGEDSDFVRVRVRGVFPRGGVDQFIGSDLVDGAATRELVPDSSAPLVMGVDIGRQGDPSVIRFRKGRDARSIAPVRFEIADLMQVAARVHEQMQAWKPDAVFIDVTGMGYGVYDRLVALGCTNVFAVNFASAADRGDAGDATAKYANKRAEMWGFTKSWLRTGCLPDDGELKAQLIGVKSGYDSDNNIQLERKEDMKKRGLASPDDADALALTFAYPVAQRSPVEDRHTADLVAGLKRRVF